MTGAQDISAGAGPFDPQVWQGVQQSILLPIACVLGMVLCIAGNWMFPGLGLALCVLTCATVVLLSLPRSIELIFFAFLFQNALIAIIGGVAGTFDGVTIAKASNFLLCMCLWGMCFVMYLRLPADADEKALLRTMFVVLVLIGIYFIIGIARNGAGAIIYLRNLIIPFACLHIALCAARYGGRVAHYPSWIAAIFIAYCYLEMAFGADFLRLINVGQYMAASTEMVEAPAVGAQDAFSVSLFNTWLFGDLGMVHRLHGPNLHPISGAYAIATLALLCVLQKRYIQLTLLLPLFVSAGSKGSIAYFLFTTGAIWAVRRFNPRLVLMGALGLAAVYAIALFIVGRNGGDFHVIGLIGSVRGFLANPLGYGIGAGGNLSVNYTIAQWQTFQHQGFTDVAVESAIGVLLYQMGVASLAVIAFYAYVGRFFWKRYLANRDPVDAFGAFGTLFILTNSIFQEEALFAPLCIGLTWMFAAAGSYVQQRYAAPSRTSASYA